MLPEDEIKMIGLDLAVGSSDNSALCPFCQGGKKKDKSFAVTRIEANIIGFKCHRNKCGRSGYIDVTGRKGEYSGTPSGSNFLPKPYNRKTYFLELEDMAFLDRMYNLDVQTVCDAGWVRGEEAGFTMVMPVWGPSGELRGHVVRQMFPDGTKKITSYKAIEGNWLCWYRGPTNEVVVVEDQISAAKISPFVTSVAILGTHLSYEKMAEIKRVAGKANIWLSLDADAHKRTLEYIAQYRGLCEGRLTGFLPKKDFKDMSYYAITSLGGPFVRNKSGNQA